MLQLNLSIKDILKVSKTTYLFNDIIMTSLSHFQEMYPIIFGFSEFFPIGMTSCYKINTNCP